jgi:hypothetical protein
MKRTSVTHPLDIATFAGPGFGRVGITFCPGKYDETAMRVGTGIVIYPSISMLFAIGEQPLSLH